jgi:hypothetical protein
MSATEFCPDDFDLLLSSFCDAGLSSAQLARFNRLLRSSAQLRRRYIRYMGVHGTLKYLIADDWLTNPILEANSRHDTRTSSTSRCTACNRRASYRWQRFAGVAVATGMLLCVVLASLAWRPHRTRSHELRKPAPIVARISGGSGVRFGGTGVSANLDKGLASGFFRLVEGIVQITFARGAELMITAPAEFEILSEMRVLLKSGKLSAKVPEQARGFTIETPTATLVDLGTEFAADVDRDGNGEVHVFRGEVIVKPRSLTDSRPLRLIGTQATRVDAASATPAGIEVDPARFVRQFEEPESSYSHLISKLGPDAYLRMEPTIDGCSLIDSGSPGGVGRIVLGPGRATPWSPGCLGSSLRLRGPSFRDYATLPFPPKRFGKTLSVVAWVFAESRPRWASIVKRWGMPGDRCFHFGLSSDDGDLEVHVAQPDGAEPLAREGRPLPTGRWHHVAFVADGSFLRLYRNGVEVAKAECSGLLPGTLDVLGVGTKLNVPGTEPDPIEPGYWHGRLDEVSIFCRALEPYEIHQLHQAALRPDGGGRR